MIALKDNIIALKNLPATIDALTRIDQLIADYSEDKPGPAYCVFEQITGYGEVKVQFDRAVAVQALQAQRERLVTYLAGLGIQA